MHFTLSSLIFGALAATAAATPVAMPASAVNITSEAKPVPLATGHLFVCTDANFQGQCQNLVFQTGVCSMALFLLILFPLFSHLLSRHRLCRD